MHEITKFAMPAFFPQTSCALFDVTAPVQAHRAPVPAPVEEPLPGEHPVPQEDPVPPPNPEAEYRAH